MTNKLKTLAIAAALITGASGMAMAQSYGCPAGYVYSGGMCQPVANNPVSGAFSGAQQGMQQGAAQGGIVGGIVGGALGTATGTIAGTTNAVGGTVNAVTGAPMMAPPPPGGPMAGACPAGYTLYNGSCYPAR
ncbi:MAG: hypothetical protein JO001_26970 [Alphaproteobacteria bacterium]|nr:hypothetical protein [Alphaproteobacteria bacterium]